ncbi:MAG: HAD-IIA family hydrolase [candidate division KSB1 bacterium]|nr:HAD-IIA family hydrolase [candidate division KSB1 bacterium]
MKKLQNLHLLEQCKAVVCDLDGTLYLDGVPIDGAYEFLDKILETGRKLFYFTNNTSKSRQTYLNRLRELEFPVTDEQIITSADCADSYLRRRELFPEIYLVGNRDLHSDFKERGYVCLDEEQARNETPRAVVLGFDTELTYEKIHACYDLVLRGVPYIATHADKLCPVTRDTFKPDVGSFISLFETATDGQVPVVAGKPTQEAVNAIAERAQAEPSKIAFIGDRLYTDIRMADQYDMVGVLVLSGETTLEMARQSSDKARIIADSVADLVAFL